MNLISWFLMIFMTTITGSFIFLLWKGVCYFGERSGQIRIIRSCLLITISFFMIPIAYVYIVYKAGWFSETIYGSMFSMTPAIIRFSKMAAVVWVLGFLWETVRYVKVWFALQKVFRRSYLAEGSVQNAAMEIENRLHMKKIPVYRVFGQNVPAIVGIRRCRIMLPDKKYEPDELQMILEHELWHYKQGDLLLKKLCAWIVRIEWYNPIARKLFYEIDKWGDIACDVQVCCKGQAWSKKQYFSAVYNNSYGETVDTCTGMSLRRNMNELENRVNRMKKYNPSKEFKKEVVFALSICFVMASALTSMAAGEGTKTIYESIYDSTMVYIEEERQVQPELEEYEWIPEDSLTIVDTGESVGAPNARGNYMYSWNIPGNTLYRTASFYTETGDTVKIYISPDPISAKTGIGLDQPNGNLRGVSGTGAYSHTFTVNQDGYHKVYARNETNSIINAAVVVTR